MKVSFTLGPSQEIRINQIASRILTENLKRNENFDVEFLNFTITTNFHLNKDMKKYYDFGNKSLEVCGTAWHNILKVALGHYHYTDLLLKELKTEYLFYSCSLTMLEFELIAEVINNDTKVIIGGPLINNYSFEDIRNIISGKVDDKEKMKNLLIIKGYVDLTTDLYEIVKRWEDYIITENDFSTFWDCEDDYIVDKIKNIKKFKDHIDLSFLDNYFPSPYSVFILDNFCYWGKCKFCYYSLFDRIDFTKGASIEKISNNIIRSTKKHKNDYVFFANDYFSFNDKYEKIMQNLIDNDIKIVIFTGIKSLQNIDYIKKINKYVAAVKIGIESFSDFSLDYIKKGYDYEDIKNALFLIKKHMKKNVFFLANLIIDLPIDSRENIITNYERANEFKKEMREAGFDINYSAKLLVVNNQTKEDFIDNKYIMVNDGDNNISGRYLLFNYFKKMGIVKNDLYKDMMIPLKRYDKNGNVLPSDFDVIPYDLAEKVFRWI
jgi:hypothetical protein